MPAVWMAVVCALAGWAHWRRYDRACQNLDRHPNYILAAFMASGS
jgi:hypothetical protein